MLVIRGIQEIANEIDYATTRQRFTTSDPHLRDAQLGCDANEPQGFFVVQVSGGTATASGNSLRHAVTAALVATVRTVIETRR